GLLSVSVYWEILLPRGTAIPGGKGGRLRRVYGPHGSVGALSDVRAPRHWMGPAAASARSFHLARRESGAGLFRGQAGEQHFLLRRHSRVGAELPAKKRHLRLRREL